MPAEKIKVVTECILATKKDMIPADLKQSIMHDADYYHFFQPNYFQLVSNLKREVSEFLGKEISHAQWYKQNAKFLSQHSFYTTHCKEQWKERNDFLITENNRILHRSDD